MRGFIQIKLLLFALAFMALGGCGGGGGGSSSAVPPTPTGSSNWDTMKWDQDNWS